jgi:PD-(D/E)XK nuclease superfamily
MTWSLTKVKTLAECGARYDFRYNKRLKEPKNEYAQRGTDIHANLEGFIRDGTPLTGKLEFYQGFLTALKNHPVPVTPELRIALTREWKPCPDDEEPWFIAFLDLFRRVEVNANFWDWKSGKIYDDHDDQKEVYALGIFCAYPEIEVVTATHVYVDLGKNREKVFARQFDFERLRDKWGSRALQLDNLQPQDLIPKPSYKCRFCGFSKAVGGPCRF